MRGSFLNLRIVTVEPSTEGGLKVAFTREPSIKRASRRGVSSSKRLPTLDAILWTILTISLGSSKKTFDSSIPYLL